MNCVAQVVKSVGPKLVPFFKTLAIYFVIFIPDDTPSVFGMVLKCLPIVSLMLFVILHGLSFADEHKYSRRILIGLIFGCIGDACLIWPQYFEVGMVSFAIGHFFYVSAFGFKPVKLPIGVVLGALSIPGLIYMMPGLHGVLKFGVPIYTVTLLLTLWRALARESSPNSWNWSKFSASVGAALFVFSDTLIGISNFRHPIANRQLLVMSSYYAAQFCIAASVVDAVPQAPSKIPKLIKTT